ncbi:MAG: hypothetical protein AB1394_16850, partial [Bacteroidota bacterium]
MKPANLLAILLTALLTTFSCKESITEPEPPAGRRDYVWKVDTVRAFGNYFNGMWGWAPNDIWTVSLTGPSENSIWHFNGNTWSVYQKETLERSCNAIWGNAKNNIWIVGSEGYIWQYDGHTWKLNFIYKQNDGYATITDIWGRNGSDVYACGVIHLASKKEQRAFILHYNGIQWKEYFKADYISQFNSILGDDKNVFVRGIRILFEANNHIKHDSVYIAKVANSKTSVLFSEPHDLVINQHLGIIGNKLHTIINNQLYSYENNQLKPVFEIKYPKFTGNFYGRNYKDIFLSMLD